MKTFVINEIYCDAKFTICIILVSLPFLFIGYLSGEGFMKLVVSVISFMIVSIVMYLFWKLISAEKTTVTIDGDKVIWKSSNRVSRYFNDARSESFSLDIVRVRYKYIPCMEQISIGSKLPLVLNKCELSKDDYRSLKDMLISQYDNKFQ